LHLKLYILNILNCRLQKEKDDACADIDRSRDKYDKLQVSLTSDQLFTVFILIKKTLP
jgi:hypothetical protein